MSYKRWLYLTIIGALICGCSRAIDSPSPTSTSPSVFIIPSVLPTATLLSTFSPTAPPLLVARKGPYLILTGDSSTLKICWQFNPPAPATLDWGLDKSYSLASIAVPAGIQDDLSCATLTQLLPATHYFYRLRSDGAAVNSEFTTRLPADAATITFWVYGDSRSGADIRDSLDAAILKEIGDDSSLQTLLFSTGDLMDNASETSLQENEFEAMWSNSRRMMSEIPVVNVMGNHDGTKLFLKYFPYPYNEFFDWSFDDGPAHFVILDQYYGGDENSPRWQWLREDLANSTKKWKIIFVHEPGWSAGPHENNIDVQKIIHPIAVRYGVAIVFAGHNHYYSRALVDGVTYITTGGAGAPLYDPENGWPNIITSEKIFHYVRVEIDGDSLTLNALTPENKSFDQLSLSR